MKRKIRRKKPAKPALPKKIFGIVFRKPAYLQAALYHPSYRNENVLGRSYENFDRMEFFGDAILNFVVCQKLYEIFPEADEGMLSKLRSILVSRRILARIAKELKLPRHMHLGKSLQKQEIYLKTKLYADVFEALIAAFYFDQGFNRTREFILKHFKSYFDAKKLFRLDPNPKSTLQELVQKHWQKLPVYESRQTDKGTETVVAITRTRKAAAVARTRRESEEKAARLLLRKLRQELLGRLSRKSSGRKLLKTL